jgi:cell division inhibitor SulA
MVISALGPRVRGIIAPRSYEYVFPTKATKVRVLNLGKQDEAEKILQYLETQKFPDLAICDLPELLEQLSKVGRPQIVFVIRDQLGDEWLEIITRIKGSNDTQIVTVNNDDPGEGGRVDLLISRVPLHQIVLRWLEEGRYGFSSIGLLEMADETKLNRLLHTLDEKRANPGPYIMH